MPPRLNWLLLVCLLFSSVAVMRAQNAYLTTSVTGSDPTGQCSQQNGQTKAECGRGWDDSEATGYEGAIAENGFGVMRGYAYSKATCIVDQCWTSDGSAVNESVYDELSIIGLQNEPTAFLDVEIECTQCTKQFAAYNSVQLESEFNNVVCSVASGQIATHCTAQIAVVYQNGQPMPTTMLRVLSFSAPTIIDNGPAGATVTTSVAFGINGGSGAYIGAAVVDAKGRMIQGVTVVGASGHIYN